MTNIVTDVEACVDWAIEKIGKRLVVGSPLGLGKPVQLINAFYRRAERDPSLSLHLFTALCLERPRPSSEIEEHLSGPIMERLFGDYEELAFLAPRRKGALPSNVTITEFYVKAGSLTRNLNAQQQYVSSNYTHAVRDMLKAGVNVLAQMVAARETDDGLQLSLSCNTDLTLEIFDVIAAGRNTTPIVTLAQTHDDLPFMELDALVPASQFDVVVRNPEYNKTLFAVPNAAVPLQDYATGLHASTLIEDDGTLQIGIGALGDAVAQACILRHTENAAYRELVQSLRLPSGSDNAHYEPFSHGLYVSTEMFVNGMMHLREAGILKRRVYDHLALQRGINSGEIGHHVDEHLYIYGRREGFIPRHLDDTALAQLQYFGIVSEQLELQGDMLLLEGRELANDLDDPKVQHALLESVNGREMRHGRTLHGGFFLGPADFYQKLRDLDERGRTEICMTGVSRTNQLLLDYPLYCAQRKRARFINTGMMVTLTGAVASDALEDGTVISGVGGQYNFVAMAHDLPGARSALCIRSTRGSGQDAKSNIIPHYGHLTIPKHLRDIVVTEYGIADLRGQCDMEIIKRLINVADSRFQEELLEFAKTHNKVAQDYRIPEYAKHNTPERLHKLLSKHRDLLPDYPFGSELTEQEQALAASLRRIKSLSQEPATFVASVFKALLHRADAQAAKPFLERIELEHPDTTREFLIQQLLLLDLEERGLLKAG